MLGNSTGLGIGHLGAANGIEQGGLSVVHMAHDGDHRRTGYRLFVLARRLGRLNKQRLRVIEFGGNCLMAHFFHHNHGRFLVEHLIDGNHLAHLHECLDHLCALNRHLVGEVCHRNGFGNMHLAHNGLCGRHKAGGRLLRVATGALLGSWPTAPVCCATRDVATGLQGTALLGIFLPGG